MLASDLNLSNTVDLSNSAYAAIKASNHPLSLSLSLSPKSILPIIHNVTVDRILKEKMRRSIRTVIYLNILSNEFHGVIHYFTSIYFCL